MSSPAKVRTRFGDLPSVAKGYVGLVIVLGWSSVAYSVFKALDGGYEALPVLILTTVLMSCLGFKVSLPLLKAGGFAFTVSDCFVFMGMLLYGPAAAVCLGAVDGLVGSLRFGIKSPYRFAFNVAGIALTALVVSNAYGLIAGSMHGGGLMLSIGTVAAVVLSGIAYFALSSLIVALALAFTSGQSALGIWGKYFPVTSPATLLSVCAGLLFLMALQLSGTTQLACMVIGSALLALSVSYGSWAGSRLIALSNQH